MCRKFLEMGFTKQEDMLITKTVKKYKNGKILPQEPDALTSEKAQSARRFKKIRDLVTHDPIYIKMRKIWRELENA